jgi:hypothetical protein
MWSENVLAAFQALGHETTLHYHNVKHGPARILAKINKFLPFTRTWFNWERLQQHELNEQVFSGDYQLLFSIQGKLDSAQIRQIRQRKPLLKIVYWFGDVFTPSAADKFMLLQQASLSGDLDLILVSYRGTEKWLTDRGFKNVVYFPFGITQAFHAATTLTAEDRERFGCDVALVGTYYPERGELISFLNKNLPHDIKVWGRSWQLTGINGNGALSMEESLKVHAAAKISLNIHHHLTDHGFNMKYYEIPAVGGFQLCDWQEEVANSCYAGLVPTFRNKEELLEQVRYYLEHEEERRVIAARMQDITWQECDYRVKIDKLLTDYNLGPCCENVGLAGSQPA